MLANLLITEPNLTLREEKAWAAGMVDGDGCFHIAKQTFKSPARAHQPCYRARVTVSQSEKAVLERVQGILGQGGKLIAISSISALSGTPLQPHYAASKGGLEAMVRAFAVRLARYDVQVNAIQPGWIVTEATQRGVDNEEFSDVIMRRTPARRWGTPEDFEGIAVYLASDASRLMNGAELVIDGGAVAS